MFILPKRVDSQGISMLEFEVTYGDGDGDRAKTYLEIRTNIAMHVHGHDLETNCLKIEITGEWERACLNSILRGDDFMDLVEAETKKCKRTMDTMSELQSQAIAADVDKELGIK